MDKCRTQFIIDHLNYLSDQIKLNDEFWTYFERLKLFPQSYIDYMKKHNLDEKTLKKNLLIDITKRPSVAYEKLTKLYQDLYKCNFLNNWNKDHYPNERPGYCLIINNEKFETIKDRDGSSFDIPKLKQTFKQLNFDVYDHSNMNKSDFLGVLEKLSKNQILNDYDLFVLIIMSHGYSSHILTVDEKYINYDDVKKFFNNQNCPQLKNKPKILIFNCCRDQITSDINKQINRYKERIDDENEDHDSIRNEIKDLVIVYSTLDNYKSVRDEENGTYFVDALVQSLNEYKDADLNRILLNANKILIEKLRENKSNTIEPRQVIEFTQLGVSKLIYFKSLE